MPKTTRPKSGGPPNQPPASALSLRRWWRSAGFAWAGICAVYRTEPNFRIEVWAAAAALGLVLWLGVSPAPILLCCGLVLGLELLNSAVEATVNLLCPQPHPLAKLAKDAAAGAVLVASLFALLVGICVFGPVLWAKALG